MKGGQRSWSYRSFAPASQVTLLTERSILCRRFLKLADHVTTGTTLNLPNYLIEVGDMGTRQYEIK